MLCRFYFAKVVAVIFKLTSASVWPALILIANFALQVFLLVSGLTNTTDTDLSYVTCKKLTQKNSKLMTSWHSAFTDCFVKPSFTCSGGNSTPGQPQSCEWCFSNRYWPLELPLLQNKQRWSAVIFAQNNLTMQHSAKYPSAFLVLCFLQGREAQKWAEASDKSIHYVVCLPLSS